MSKKFSIIKRAQITFIVLLFIVPLIQFSLLRSQLNYGLSTDDVAMLSEFKFLGDNPFGKILTVWNRFGPHFTSPIYTIGILSILFDSNYHNYYFSVLLLKIISSLTLYPLILIITRKQMLAFLAVIIYSIHYSPVGSLEMVVRTQDFLAISVMNIFLALYVYTIEKEKRSIWWLGFISLILILCFAINPIRIFPILSFILFIEGFFVIRSINFSYTENLLRKFNSIQLKRTTLLFAPYVLLFLYSRGFIFGEIQPAFVPTLQRIVEGNWQLLLSPLASLGSMFFMENKWGIFGMPTMYNLVSSLTIYFSLLILLFLPIFLVISKQPRELMIRVFVLYPFSNILIFISLAHWQTIDLYNRINFDFARMLPPVLFGNFILILTYCFWKEWTKDMRDRIWFILWISPVFSLLFIVQTWPFVNYFTGIQGYLTVPAIGTSTFIATLIYIIYIKLKAKFNYIGNTVFLFVFLSIIPMYQVSSQLINQYLISHLESGMKASDQLMMRDKLKLHLSKFSYEGPSIFYFDSHEDERNGTFYQTTMLNEFHNWMKIYDPLINSRCLIPLKINDKTELLKRKIITDKQKGFKLFYSEYPVKCSGSTFVSIDNFYAFKLKNKEILDIKPQIMKELGF